MFASCSSGIQIRTICTTTILQIYLSKVHLQHVWVLLDLYRVKTIHKNPSNALLTIQFIPLTNNVYANQMDLHNVYKINK
jgi:hypothetical protein